MLGLVAITLGCAVVGLTAALIVQLRRARALRESASQLEGIVRGSRYAERLRPKGSASTFADSGNRLLEQLAIKDLLIRERERALEGLLAGLHEAVAIHRE